jgi:hypothetical protein
MKRSAGTPLPRRWRLHHRWRQSRIGPGRLVCLLVAGAGALSIAPVSPATPARAQADSLTLALVDQTVSIRPGESFTVLVKVTGRVPPEGQFVLLAHSPLSSRGELHDAVDGDVGPALDLVRLPVGEVSRRRGGVFELVVPTTAGPLEVGVLRLAVEGVHPLTVQIHGPPDDPEATADPGDPMELLGELATFIHVQPETGTRGVLEVAYVAQITSHPTRRPDGGTTIDPHARDQVERLATLLEQTSAAFSTSLAPELLEGLTRSDEDDLALLRRLEVALGPREVLVEPYVTMDPSGAARSSLLDTYTRQLRLGEDTVARVLPRQVARRSAHLVDGPVDAGGASLLRDLGMRSLVLLPTALRSLDDPALSSVDPTLLVDVLIGVEATMPAAVVDPSLADALRDATDPVMDAHLLVMELLLIRQQAIAAFGGEDPALAAIVLAGRTLTLSTPDGEVADPLVTGRLLELVQSTPGLAVTTASVAGTITDTAIVDGLPVTVPLPFEAGPDLDQLADRLYGLTLDAITVGSMLPPGDPRPESWERQMNVMPATELTAAELDGFEATVRNDLDFLRAAVATPSVSDVTLGGRRSTIRIKLRNDADVALTVSVRMESSKLSFPRGEEVVTIPAGDLTEVEIPVEARTNGSFPVSVTLLTPAGEVPLHDPVEFTARVNALTGLGQVVTFAGAVILFSWWVHHFRTRRRDRRALARASTLEPS